MRHNYPENPEINKNIKTYYCFITFKGSITLSLSHVYHFVEREIQIFTQHPAEEMAATN